MKIGFVAPLALLLVAAVPQATVQAQQYQGPSITIPLPGVAPERRDEGHGDRERHCAELGSREHDLHERLERASYNEDRARLENELRETQERQRDDCRH
jgi:hypothetical protein